MSKLYPDIMQDIMRFVASLPGTGRKSSEKIALSFFQMPPENLEHFSKLLHKLHTEVSECTECGYFSKPDMPCDFCADQRRDKTTLCVVETINQVIPIEKSSSYRGLYHILNGKLSPLHRIGPQDLRLEELKQRVAQNGVQEVILATSTDMEGETTASFIHDMLENVEGLTISRIALGIPVGADLSYADAASMALAISKRRDFD